MANKLNYIIIIIVIKEKKRKGKVTKDVPFDNDFKVTFIYRNWYLPH